VFAAIGYKQMQYADQNTTCIQNNEILENHDFLRILTTHL